jgi:hypothetical protein
MDGVCICFNGIPRRAIPLITVLFFEMLIQNRRSKRRLFFQAHF